MDIRARLPQPYDDLQGSGQKTGAKRVGLPCCAITARYLRSVGAWEGTLLLVQHRHSQLRGALTWRGLLERAGWYCTSCESKTQATRAILLAKATVAPVIPRLAMSCWSHRARGLGFSWSFHRDTTARAP